MILYILVDAEKQTDFLMWRFELQKCFECDAHYIVIKKLNSDGYQLEAVANIADDLSSKELFYSWASNYIKLYYGENLVKYALFDENGTNLRLPF